MTATERVITEIFGEPPPPLTPDQHAALTAELRVQVETLFHGSYYPGTRGERNRAIVRRVLLDRIPLKQAAVEFSLTPSRIGQFRLKGLRMLRHPLRSRPLRNIFQNKE